MATIARTMPAEWEPHAATWIAWPHHRDDWLDKFAAIDWVYAEIVRALIDSERVEILCHDEAIQSRAKEVLDLAEVSTANVRLHTVANNRSWLRDSLPTAVRTSDNSIEWIAWQFNAWAKYDNYQLDQSIPAIVSEITQIPYTQAMRADEVTPLVLEGGAFDTDGCGTLLVTEECLLSTIQERNPGLTKADYEAVFAKYLGISKTIWLGSGCLGDDTHGHVDDIARFVRPSTVVVCVPSDKDDPNFLACHDNYQRLLNETDAQGNELEVIPLPMPRLISFAEEILPASYANFYIANKSVLVPTFNDPSDRIVLDILSELFPNRRVLGIHSLDLVVGQGTLHCLTQQQPV